MNGIETSAAAFCLGPERGGAFEVRRVLRQRPAADEIEVAVEAAAVNPIDVKRSKGYGRPLLSLRRAAKFPLVLGNDFAGTVTAAGAAVSAFKIGDRVYGLKPPSAMGTHACHVVVKAAHARPAPSSNEDIQKLAGLPYSFVTMWLAARGQDLRIKMLPGRKCLSMAPRHEGLAFRLA